MRERCSIRFHTSGPSRARLRPRLAGPSVLHYSARPEAGGTHTRRMRCLSHSTSRASSRSTVHGHLDTPMPTPDPHAVSPAGKQRSARINAALLAPPRQPPALAGRGTCRRAAATSRASTHAPRYNVARLTPLQQTYSACARLWQARRERYHARTTRCAPHHHVTYAHVHWPRSHHAWTENHHMSRPPQRAGRSHALAVKLLLSCRPSARRHLSTRRWSRLPGSPPRRRGTAVASAYRNSLYR